MGTDGIALLTVAYSGNTPLTPNGNGGWLNPNPSSPADQLASVTGTNFQIPVDDVIRNAQGLAPGQFQTEGNFTVTYDTRVFPNTHEMTADFTDQVLTGGMSKRAPLKPGVTTAAARRPINTITRRTI